MRVLFLNPCAQMGGAETSLRELMAGLRAAAPGWELLLVLGEDGPLAGKARGMGVRVIVAPFPKTLNELGDTRQNWLATAWLLLKAAIPAALYARRLDAIIRSAQPDIVHSNGFKMHLLGAWKCPRRIPLVWHIHDYVSSRPLMSRLLRRCAHRCATAIANSESVAADLKNLIPGLKIAPIYNAVDLARYAPAGSVHDLDALSGLSPAPAGVIRAGLVGTFARWKGHKVFLRALSLLSPGAAVRGYVIGAAIYRTKGSQWSLPELQQEADRLGLAGRVGFTGFLDDTAAAMRSLDIIVHASTQAEPFGMVIIEGMACGKAVIVSQGGGAEEIFEDGKDAVAHIPGDAAGLAAQIQRLAADRDLRSSLGNTGRAKVERLFNGGRLAGQLIALYRDVANKADFGPVLALKPETAAQSD